LRNPPTSLPEELLKKAEEELARVAAVGSNEESVMADDKLNRGEPDRSRINMSEDYEVKYWTERLGTTREELQKVVDRVGNSANAVAKEFGPGRLVGSPVSYDTGLVLRV
jgi:hypothetical protein